jgi:hypothetical protein
LIRGFLPIASASGGNVDHALKLRLPGSGRTLVRLSRWLVQFASDPGPWRQLLQIPSDWTKARVLVSDRHPIFSFMGLRSNEGAKT